MMYYLESGMRGAPSLTLNSMVAYKDLLTKIFIDGMEPFKPDAIEGQKLIFNGGLVTNELTKYVIYDANNRVITKLKKLNNNEFVAVEDISILSANDILVTYPKPNNFELIEETGGFTLKNEFGGFSLYQSSFNSGNQRANGVAFRGIHNFNYGFAHAYVYAGYRIIYGENGFIIINPQNGQWCFLIMLINKDISIYSNENSFGGYDGWTSNLIKGTTNASGASKLNLLGDGNVNVANNPLCIAPVYFGGHPSIVLRNFFGSIPVPANPGVFERLPFDENLGDYAIIKSTRNHFLVFYLGDE